MSDFPKCVILKKLPEDYTFTEVAETLQEHGTIVEMKRGEGQTLFVEFEDGESARALVRQASSRNQGGVVIRKHRVFIIPKRDRHKASE